MTTKPRYKIKKILKKLLPEFILDKLWKIATPIDVMHAYIRFLLSRKNPKKLTWEELDHLEKEYYISRKKRTLEDHMNISKKRIQKLFSLLPKKERPQSLLETGAGHALFSVVAQKEFDIKATAIDLNIRHNPELEKADVSFETMNVTKMSFPDNTFDCVVSFDAFEHFMEPEKALSEMIRVTKPKGFIFLNFGPLYYSPWGLHAYYWIHVPYCQFFFDRKLMEDYLEKNNLGKITQQTLNKWSICQYNQLWQSFSDRIDIVHKKVTNDYRQVKLICQYPDLLKSQTTRFRDLVNSHITLLFQKR